MAEAAVRCLRDGRLDGEHALALSMEGSLQCCPLAAGAMLHVAATLASQVAAGKAQSRGMVIVVLDRSPEVYLDFMSCRGLDSNALDRWEDTKCNCGTAHKYSYNPLFQCKADRLICSLACHCSGPVCSDLRLLYGPPWMEAEDSKSAASREQQKAVLNKQREYYDFQKCEDVKMLMNSTTELGGGFQGEGKKYFSIAVDSISSMLRHASLPSISGLLSNLRSHDQVSSIFWLVHSDLHEPKVPRAFECLSTMVACVEPALVDPAYGESPGVMSFLEQNYTKVKFIFRLKRRNGRVKHFEIHVEGNDVKFVSAPSVNTEVNQSLLPKVQFNLELSEKERSDRANVVLPFKHQGKGEPIRIYDGRRSLPNAQQDPSLAALTLVDEIKTTKSETAKGEIHYIRDSDDEQPDSDEDPDDDLDI